MSRCAFTRGELLVVLAIVGIGLACACLCGGFFLVPFVLAFGWIPFLVQAVRRMTVEPAALVVAGAALAGAAALVHGLAGWLYRHAHAGQEPAPRWRFRWTAASVGLVLFLAMAGIGMVVTVHQVGWLVRSDRRWVESSSSAIGRFISSNNLKQIGLGFHNYHDQHQRFPPGGTFNRYGEAMHSWETHLLPYLESPVRPNLELPWNHPQNAEHFRKPVPCLYSYFWDERTDASGYALSHYAANRRVAGGNFSLRLEDVTDEQSNTTLAGEVRRGFRPWGDPVNWRDPALGLGDSPETFGGPPRTHGTQFLMVDGSVRFLNEDVDPQVLKALSTPAGGEPLPAGGY